MSNPPRAARVHVPVAASALLAAVLGLACATSLPPASEEEQRAYDAAERHVEGDPASARDGFETFLATWPDSSLADGAEYALAGLAQREGDAETALLHYWRVVNRGRELADPARVRIAEIEQGRGNAAAALEVLGNVRLSRLDVDNQRAAYRVLADAAPDPVARLRWLAALRKVASEDDLRDVDAEIDEVIASLDAAALRRADGQLKGEVPAARVAVTEAERALDAGDLEAAAEALDRASALPLAPRYATRLAAAKERLRLRAEGPADVSELPTFAAVMGEGTPDTSSATGTIGLILPLTGPFSQVAEEVLHGVLLAAGVFDREGHPRPKVRVLVRDTAGRPERAVAAVRELAANPFVTAIVGPLLSGECAAAAAAAEEEGVPLLALTVREEVARGRSHVFRLRTRPLEETQLVVDRAFQAGARRFAILYRDDNYGFGLRDLFWSAVEARGGRIVGVAKYDPQATDFADPIRRLVGFVLLDDEERRLLAKREAMRGKARRLPPEEALEMRQRAAELTTRAGHPIPPIVDFDALFIAESHENVVLIAPQLAFHEVTEARLLGPNGWYDPDLVRLGGDHVEGALFAAHFFPDSEVPFVRDFTERFEESFGHAPDEFAALAYDAANLAILQMARGHHTRDGVRDGVLAVEAYPGVSGVLTMRADGNAQKRPYLLGVERGRVIQYVE